MNILIKSLNYTKYSLIILLLLPLTFIGSMFLANNTTSVVEAQSYGVNTMDVRIYIEDANTNKAIVSIPGYPIITIPNRTGERQQVIPDTNFEMIVNGLAADLLSQGKTEGVYFFSVPIPLVNTIKFDNKSIDSIYPDKIILDTTKSTTTIGTNKVATTRKKACSGSQCSVTFNIPIKKLKALNSSKTLPDFPITKGGVTTNFKPLPIVKNNDFISTDLKGAGDDEYLFIEFCYENNVKLPSTVISTSTPPPPVSISGGITATSTPAPVKYNLDVPRKIIGGNELAQYNVYPPFLSESKQFSCLAPEPEGTNFTANGFLEPKAPPSSATNLSGGTFRGEFFQTTTFGSISCTLTNNLIASDLFGNRTIGVQTALGCLPGNLNGLSAVILRIAIGISGAILFILILFNAFIIITGSPEPAKIKEAIANIVKGITAFIIIVFAIFLLNLIGVKIIPLGELGGAPIEQVTGQ